MPWFSTGINLRRQHMGMKRWGVFEHYVDRPCSSLGGCVLTRAFNVPHSRFNDVSREAFESAGLGRFW